MISSRENSIYKRLKRLRIKKYRDREGEYIIEGPNLVKEAILTDQSLPLAFLSENLGSGNFRELAELKEQLIGRGTSVEILKDDLFTDLADTETPQGIIAIVKKRLIHKDFFLGRNDKENGNFIVIDRLQDPGNIGTILRTADSASYQGAIIVKGTGDVYAPKVVRAATGSLFRLPLLFVKDAEEAVNLLKYYGKRIICGDPRGTIPYYDCNLKNHVAIVIGNEGNGISHEFLAISDAKVKIPMNPQVESLNASIAAAILIYETIRK